MCISWIYLIKHDVFGVYTNILYSNVLANAWTKKKNKMCNANEWKTFDFCGRGRETHTLKICTFLSGIEPLFNSSSSKNLEFGIEVVTILFFNWFLSFFPPSSCALTTVVVPATRLRSYSGTKSGTNHDPSAAMTIRALSWSRRSLSSVRPPLARAFGNVAPQTTAPHRKPIVPRASSRTASELPVVWIA